MTPQITRSSLLAYGLAAALPCPPAQAARRPALAVGGRHQGRAWLHKGGAVSAHAAYYFNGHVVLPGRFALKTGRL